jgi:diguanylate cyclase (GGDEF)-like protein
MKSKKRSIIPIIDFMFIMMFMIFIAFFVIDVQTITNTLKKTERHLIESDIKGREKIINSLLEFGMYDELKKYLQGIVINSNNEYLSQVYLKTKKFSYSFPKKTFKCADTVKVPLINNGKKIGFIKLCYDDKFLLKVFFHNYIASFIVYVILLLIYVILVLQYMRRKVKDLNRLANILEKIDFKRFQKINMNASYYEIENIINVINNMLAQIHKYYKIQKENFMKLYKYKEQLETTQKISKMFSWEYDCKKEEFNTLGNINEFIEFGGGINTMDELLNHIPEEERKIFLANLSKICKNCEEFSLIHKVITDENKTFYIHSQGKCIKDFFKKQKIIVGACMDVTQEIKKQQKIEYLAYHDPLTSLPNRAFLKEHLKYLARIHKRYKQKFAVLYLDLDNFKFINDTFGHEKGDVLLIELSVRIKSILREADVFVRLGGDEFIIVLNDVKEKESIIKVIKKIQERLKEPFIIDNSRVYVTFSIGVAVYPDDTNNVDELLQYADIAMYQAKNRGKNDYYFITDELKKEINEYYESVNELKEGLKKNEFVLFFQPKVDIVHNKIYGAEGLIRWNHPKKGILTPYHFISYAEKAGIINQIDRYVLKKAFETLAKWQKDERLKNLELAVNVSPIEFRQNDFIDNIKNLIKEYKIDPSKLEIEITETLSMEDVNYTIVTLNDLRNLGIKVAIDDFGTGYSSLNYIKKLPFDTLKIDQSFIKDLLKDQNDFVITKMIIEIGHILQKKVIAEGVENSKLLHTVKKLGCRFVQGYVFSKPLEEKNFYDYLKDFHERG